jgi:hypothetical protein
MRKRRRRAPAHYRDDYYEDDDYYARRRGQRRPNIIQRFFITLLWIACIIIAITLLVLIAFHYALFIKILVYALYVAGGLAILGALYLAARLISAISLSLSKARHASALAKQERVRVKQEQERIKLAQSKRTREEYAFYNKQQPRREELPISSRESPYRTRKLPPPPDESLVRAFATEGYADALPASATPEPHGVPGMPLPGQVFYYANYCKLIRPGELIIGVRRDGTARLGTWQDFKVLLILGSSSSGKTTTMVEKALGAARGGGQLVVCDPHGYKQDSLLRKISPLQGVLMPGTVFAIEHADIMHNVEAVKRELDRRVRGGSCDIPIFLIIEELNRLQRDKAIANELKEILQTLGQEGRGFNVYAIVGAQQITHLAEIRKSIISFAIHRVDESEARLCIPARFAKYSSELGVGQTFVKDADGMTEPLQQILVTVQDVQRQAQMLQHSRRQIRTTVSLPERLTTEPDEQPSISTQSDNVFPQRRKSRLVAHPLAVPTVPLPPKPTKNLQQPASAIWMGDKLVLSEEPDTQQEPQTRTTEEVSKRQIPAARQTEDIVQQNQASLAQQKLDRLEEIRSARRKNK